MDRLGAAHVIVIFVCSGCAATLIPPKKSRDAVAVHIADYGYHSTVIFPSSNGSLMEYAYGDWTFMANNQKSLGTTFGALFASEQATLGRRYVEPMRNASELQTALGAVGIIRIEAPREKVLILERDLDRRFSARLDSILYSDLHKLYFVKDDEHYSLGHNCNHVTAQWLEQLGCRIEGIVVSSKFKLKDAGETQYADP